MIVIKQVKRLFSSKLFCVVAGAALGVLAVLAIQHYNPKDEGPQPLAASVVFERIVAQNELVGASQRYNMTEKMVDSNKIDTLIGSVEVPFTQNSFWYRYVGQVKAGVNLSEATYEQKPDGTIVVSLPSPYIISNTPDMDASSVLEENNNIFNPIHIEDVDAFRAQCMQKGEEDAVANGLMDEAKSNTEINIRGIFVGALGGGVNVEFEWR